MTHAQDTRTIAEMGLSPLMQVFAALPPDEPPASPSLVSPESLAIARDGILGAIGGLRRIETFLRAYSRADTDEPNAATDAIEDLRRALAALGGAK